MNRWLTVVPLLALPLLAGCGQEPRNDTPAVEHARLHLDPTYVCPMHPAVTSDEPGECPICGMDLVEREPPADSGFEGPGIVHYRHPHDPTITSPTPMQDEMGMDFVPVYADGSAGTVRVDPGMQQSLGVTTAPVERDTLWRLIRTVGYVGFDEGLMRHVHTRAEGWIERLVVDAVGARVDAGDPLFELYSPTLATAQEEYLQALALGNRALVSSGRDRLQALGFDPADVEALEKTRRVTRRVTIRAEAPGVVTALDVREGMYVTPPLEVMALADLSRVWVEAEVFDRQLAWVEVGKPAEIEVDAWPGRTWEGEVDFVYPTLDEKTRTLSVRLAFDNPDERLKPGMYADVVIYGGPLRDALVVPRRAVIRSGTEARVVVALGDGRFAPRRVEPGIEVADRIQILDGLEAGERVVTSAQFLIDSEAELDAALSRLAGGDEHAGHAH